MPSTYSTRLRFENIATGDQSGTWGDSTNNNIGTLIEEAIAGMASVTHSDAASYTLTSNNAASDEARCMIIKVGGTLTAQRNVVCPSVQKIYLVFNNTSGGNAITFKTSGGTGVDISNGARRWVYCDGTNVLNAETAIALSNLSISGATSLTGADTADTIPIYDTSATSNKQVSFGELMKAINTLSAETGVDTADSVLLYDSSASTADKATVNELFKAVNTFTAETAVDTADVLYLYDTSATTADKATVNNLFKGVSTFTALTAVDTADSLFIYDTSATSALRCTVNELFKAVSSFTAETAVDSADVLPLYDTSAATADSATVAQLFKAVSTLTEDTTPDSSNDFVLSYDASATAAKKVKISNLASAAPSAASQAQMEAAASSSVYSAPSNQQYHPLHPKAWALINNNGTASITTGSGVTSVSRSSTGIVVVNWTTSFSTANYAVIVTGGQSSTQACVSTFATGSATIRTTDLSGTLQDRDFCIVALGDQ